MGVPRVSQHSRIVQYRAWLPPSYNGQRAGDRPRPEYAPSLIPAWTIVVLAVLLALPLVPWLREATPVHQASVTPPAVGCGARWSILPDGAGGYRVRTLGASVTLVPLSCLVRFAPIVPLVLVHGTGDAFALTGSPAIGTVTLPAGGWWQQPIGPAHTLLIAPDPHGGALDLTILTPARFPS